MEENDALCTEGGVGSISAVIKKAERSLIDLYNRWETG